MLVYYNKKNGEVVMKMMNPPEGGIPEEVRPADWAAVEANDEDAIDGKTHRVSSDGKVERKSKSEIQAAYDKDARTELRLERNRRLAASDKAMLLDSGRDRGAWARYRQELRDLPANTTDPHNPIWPKKPDE